jgi:predicted transcriptional regulator of viral defense system
MSTPIEDLLDELGSVFRWSEARSAGLTQPRLYRLIEAGRVERIGHGLYLRTDAPPMDLDLIEVASAAPRATLCLTSALAHHGLIDDIPSRIHLALPANAHRPVLTAAVSWHQFAAETFDMGRGDLEVAAGFTIGLYDSVRSIVDAYRLRHLVGVDTAREALRSWLRGSGNQPSVLLLMAASFPKAAPQIRSDLEVLR